MNNLKLRPEQQTVVDRFIRMCQDDERISGAFLGGSYAKGTADAWSDLDLFIVIPDTYYQDVFANRNEILNKLGEPGFMDSFGSSHTLCFILDNGVAGDLIFRRESQLDAYPGMTNLVLLDKKDILNQPIAYKQASEPVSQVGTIRRLMAWFWHDWVHFTTALHRGQLWFAQGQLEILRGYCVSLLRLLNDINDEEAGSEPYFKVENVLYVERLSRLEATVGPLEKGQLQRAGRLVADVFKELAHSHARLNGISYPENLEKVLLKELDKPA